MISVDEIRARLQTRAEDAARDDETATVQIGTRSDMPAWGAEVSWVGPNGECETTGYAGRLEDLERHVTLQIEARKQLVQREAITPPPPPRPQPGHLIQDIRPNDPFKRIRH
jgi:hypothetical protein